MMLLLDFAVGSVNRCGGKKNQGNHSNNNTDREYLSVSRMLLLQATVKRFQFDLYVNLEGQQMLISSWFQK